MNHTRVEAPESFYVGGRHITEPDGSHLLVGQMYVRRLGEGDLLPIVLVPGGAQTGAHWEMTPDGRPGLAPLLAGYGHPTYVVDLPGIGRSRYHLSHHGPLLHYTAELTEYLFTAPAAQAWPGAGLHTQWPGSGRRGEATFEAFYAGQVGRLLDDRAAESSARSALSALLDRIGPCHLLTHSQAGPYGWHVADARPELVRSVVALEPKGPPYFEPRTEPVGEPPRPYGITTTPLTYDPALDGAGGLPFTVGPDQVARQLTPARTLSRLRAVPVLLITAEASYHDTYDHLTVQFLRDAGVTVDHVRLGEHGIHGNGHLLALELNNGDIAELIHRKLAAQQAPR